MSNFVKKIVFFLLFISPVTHAYEKVGVWWSGAGKDSYPSFSTGCQSFKESFNSYREKIENEQAKNNRLISTISMTVAVDSADKSPNPFVHKCVLKVTTSMMKDGSELHKTIVKKITASLTGAGSGANAERYLPSVSDLSFMNMPYWKFKGFREKSPVIACQKAVEGLIGGNGTTISYDHLETYHFADLSFNATYFNCIVKAKSSVNGLTSYFSLGKIVTDGLTGEKGRINIPCQNGVCSSSFGSFNDDEIKNSGSEFPTPSNPKPLPPVVDPDRSTNPSNVNLSNIENALFSIKAATNKIADKKNDTSSITSRQEIGNKKLDAINKTLSDSAKEIIDSQLTKNDFKGLFNALGASDSDSMANVATVIKDSSASSSNKADAIKQLLQSGFNDNNANSQKLINALNELEKTNNNSNLSGSISENAKKISNSVSQSGGDVVNSLNGVISANNSNTKAIVNAINGVKIGDSGTTIVKGEKTDVSGVESRLDALNDSVDKIVNIKSSDKKFNEDPTKGLVSFWQSKYPQGINGILNKFKADLSDTPINKWLNSFTNQLADNGDFPLFKMDFNLGFVDFGRQEFSLDPKILLALRALFLLSASFVCRRIVFGG